MNKYFIIQSFLIIIGIFLLFCSGCGGDSNVTILPTANPVISPTPSSDYPLSDQKFRLLTDEEISSDQGLPSRKLNYVTQCINLTPVESSSNISSQGGAAVVTGIGKMLFTIAYRGQVKEDLYKINKEIQALAAEIDILNQKLDNLSTQLAITQVNIQTYISSLNVQNYLTSIKTAYSTTSEAGLVYYSNQAVLLDANSPDAVPLETLQRQETVYIANVTAPSAIAFQVQGIHDSICPDLSSLNGVLKDYTNKIILDSSQNGNNQNVKDPANTMSTYLLLETYYTQLLTYQFQGATILVNAYNVQDTTGNQAKSYINGTFKNLLKDEMARYLNTVDYMVINLVDYRDPNTYTQDMAYYNQGLATDKVYLDVLARSRFFCAQIMEAYEDNFGLYGAIVTPYDYTNGANITLSFQGPSSFSNTIQPQQYAGVYPYTKWVNVQTSSPDNQWLFYDIPSTDPNIPAGTYNVSFTGPWPHTDNKLGSVSVKYYDPNNPDPNTATLTPTETNTLKFGYFSLKWPWGYQRLCTSTMGYWIIPPISDNGDDLNPFNDQPNPCASNLEHCSFAPRQGASGFINQMYMSQPRQYMTEQESLLRYVIKMPLIPGGAPGDSSTVSGKIIYYNTADITTTVSEDDASTSTQYEILFNDNSKDKNEKIITYSSSDHNLRLNKSDKGFTSFTIYKDSSCDVTIDETYHTKANLLTHCQGSADMTITWYMQFIYTNTYNIFQ